LQGEKRARRSSDHQNMMHLSRINPHRVGRNRLQFSAWRYVRLMTYTKRDVLAR
jgi:hypothetical protein